MPGPGEEALTWASSSRLCGLHTWAAFPWVWDKGLPTDVDRFLLHSSGSWIKLYLKKTRLHKPIRCHHVYASLGWTLTLLLKGHTHFGVQQPG